MTIRMLKSWNGYPEQSIQTFAGAEETRLIGLGFATASIGYGSSTHPLYDNLTLNATHDGKQYACKNALSVNVGVPGINLVLLAPPSGSLTLVSANGILLNGATTSIVVTSPNNAIALIPTDVPGSYIVEGV